MNKQNKLAVIDDDEDIQELISSFFRNKGYLVTAYSDAALLFAEIQKSGVCIYDVIITDLLLPTISGIEFTKKMKEFGSSVPIILVTGQKSAEVAVQAIQAGAYDFVVKPIHFPQLLVSLERAIYLNQIKADNLTLKMAISVKEGANLDGIIGKSPALLKVIDLAKRVSTSNANIFISGETGSGKEVIAKAIHRFSHRNNKPFIAINCCAIPENLLESELFGHAKGSFTGAISKKLGLFEEADGGTLFLDEIGDLSLPLQSKLLRVLQERKIKRIGENQMREIDVRVISATHRNIRREIVEQRFREDLFFRLNVIPVSLPPLRERKDDILLLADFFIKKYSIMNNRSPKNLSKEAVNSLLINRWPGNVRELENAIERAVVLSQGSEIEESDVIIDNPILGIEALHVKNPYLQLDSSEIIESLDSITNRYIAHALKLNRGAKDKTARDLGIDRKTLYRRVLEMETKEMPLKH
jgi:two-component system, NtrC family, response regulator HydG